METDCTPTAITDAATTTTPAAAIRQRSQTAAEARAQKHAPEATTAAQATCIASEVSEETRQAAHAIRGPEYGCVSK